MVVLLDYCKTTVMDMAYESPLHFWIHGLLYVGWLRGLWLQDDTQGLWIPAIASKFI
jgi:hypothetical protein